MTTPKPLYHIHPVYAAWHCGAKDGIRCTNPKDVTCPDCLRLMGEKVSHANE